MFNIQIMKIKYRKWGLRLVATCIVVLGLLLAIVLNPILLYANKSNVGNYTICSQHLPDPYFIERLNNATELLKTSELYDGNQKLTICINDGSAFPRLVQAIQGPAFAYAYYHNVVLNGAVNARDNYVELNGYKWNLTELLAHEATHCMQSRKYGLLHSNPIARYPQWKWEGYPEYVARKNKASLSENISHLIETEHTDNNNWISFDDSTGTVIPYYKSWLLMQYCLDIRKMSYTQLLEDTTCEALFTQYMMNWYATRK